MKNKLIATLLILAAHNEAFADNPTETLSDPRFYSFPTTTDLHLTGRVAPGNSIKLTSRIIPLNNGGIAVRRIPGFPETKIGGYLTYTLNGGQIAQVRVESSNTPVNPSDYITYVDQACVIAGLPPPNCTFRYYFARSSELSVNYTIPANARGAQSFGATFSGDDTFSRGSTASPINTSIRKPDLLGISKQGASGRTEIYVLSGESNYQTVSSHIVTALGRTGNDGSWAFFFTDFNRDGINDLFAVGKYNSPAHTDIHILDGATQFQSFLLENTTALGQAGSDYSWAFSGSDYNNDGFIDIYAIGKQNSPGKTDIHILNGADNFQTFLLERPTLLGNTGTDSSWAFVTADYNKDGKDDIYSIGKRNSAGGTDVHILNGSNQFQSFLLETVTALGQVSTDGSWAFSVGDYNLDGFQDIYAIGKINAAANTTLHILDGASNFRSFLLQTATALPRTGVDNSWDFVVGNK